MEKKICHITSVPQNFIPRILRECSSALKSNLKPIIIAQGKDCEKDSIDFIGIKTAKNRKYRLIITRREILKKAMQIDADIYQIHSPELLPYGLRLKSKGKIVIFDSHEFYGEHFESKEYIPKILRRIFSKVYIMFESFFCRRIDGVIAVCTINNRDYFKGRTRKTIFVSNLPQKKDFIHISNKNKISKSIIYAGSLSYSRGITNIIKAIDNISISLVLCGKFSSDKYYNQLKEMKGFSKVKYLGILPKEKLIDELYKSYIGISTLLGVGQYSKIDTLPTKVYEYMAAGIPVIISKTKYSKKMIDLYKFGIYVDPYNINEISNAITYLINNPKEAKNMGENGRKAFVDLFNWEKEEEKLINLYRKLI